MAYAAPLEVIPHSLATSSKLIYELEFDQFPFFFVGCWLEIKRNGMVFWLGGWEMVPLTLPLLEWRTQLRRNLVAS